MKGLRGCQQCGKLRVAAAFYSVDDVEMCGVCASRKAKTQYINSPLDKQLSKTVTNRESNDD